ncbi:MAG TPA: esterase-like activity of phytase family protein [Vicinamibacteria bacterium]|nr:esterase-like activity of phytase family protein [Vicinamibacteria bacterium]
MRRRRDPLSRRWLWPGCLAAAVLAVLGTLSGLSSGPRADVATVVSVAPLALDSADPRHQRVGALRYLGGLWLRSPDPRFGGLSDLRVSADGGRVFMISDCGRGFTAALSYDAQGRLDGLSEPRLYDLVGLQGQPLAVGEEDSESLVIHGDALEVGFEGRARIWAFDLTPPFGGPARPVAAPAGLRGCGFNEGIETMAMLDATRRLLVCEGRRQPSLDVPAWIGDGSAWTERRYPLRFEGVLGEPFRPTSATVLPGGDVLVLERRFPPLAARVVRLLREDVLGEGPLHPREIARLVPPLTVDNMEGIDTRRDESGRTLVYLVSDDNNCAKRPGGLRGTGLQRTLLLLFSLED